MCLCTYKIYSYKTNLFSLIFLYAAPITLVRSVMHSGETNSRNGRVKSLHWWRTSISPGSCTSGSLCPLTLCLLLACLAWYSWWEEDTENIIKFYFCGVFCSILSQDWLNFPFRFFRPKLLVGCQNAHILGRVPVSKHPKVPCKYQINFKPDFPTEWLHSTRSS